MSNTSRPRQKSTFQSLILVAAAFSSTLLSLSVDAALTIPPVPLQVGTPLEPNIMLILDDSGSMDWDFMPGAFNNTSVPAVSPVAIQLQAYPRNTLYYNPTIPYAPWKTATGVVAGGTTLASVWTDTALAAGSADISGSVHTFYVPKTAASDLAQTSGYYRYQILPGPIVRRSEYGAVMVTAPTTESPAGFPTSPSGNVARDQARYYSFSLPNGATDLRVTTTGNGSNRAADLYVNRGNSVARNNRDCESESNGSDETCDIGNPGSGNWSVLVYAERAYSNLVVNVTYRMPGTSNRCGTGTGSNDWINCADATPTGRSAQAEAENFATWYSYHRTRMKVAKAGASAAFADLNGNYRVGFTTIWGPTQASRNEEFLLNVGSNNGLFEDRGASVNRTTWFERLHAARADNGTPLLDALDRMGRYYSDGLTGRSGVTGPYGPQASPLACRQNFSILTTDGYWNSNTVTPGNADDIDGSNYVNKDGVSKKSYTAGPPYRDSSTGTLADVAMKYWKTDLMPGLVNNVPASEDPTKDTAFWQHMVTFGIALGLQGTLTQKTVADVHRDGTTGFNWPNPLDAEDNERIDDLLHAAVNGRGAFAAATNPVDFANALRAALAGIEEDTSSGSSLAFNSAEITADTKTYAATFFSGPWTGEVEAYSVTATGPGATPVWNASAGIPLTGRKIYTYGGTTGSAVTPATFPTSTQEATLTTAIANYIKGSRVGEGAAYRTRNSLFGDIVHSSPVYVDTGTSKTVYVGANDGMLHAINADDGTERFTYVPRILDMTRLRELSRRNDFVHQYFVDGPIAVSTRAQTPGENILIGTLGRGGKGVYALDVSTPETFGTAGTSWEFAGDDDMGMVLGKPQLVRVNAGTGGTMSALVSNGINSVNGKAALFVINLATGALIRKIPTNNELDNGLSVPTGLDTDGNGTVDMAYAGDQQGNVWRFNLSSSNPADWAATKLFTATDPAVATKRQPISGGVTLAYNPTTYTPWVFFGTGRYLVETDPTDTTVQSWYGIEDDGTAISGRGVLKTRQIKLAGVIDGKPVRAFEGTAVGDMASTPKGWVVDLKKPPSPGTAEGERMIGEQFVIAGNVLVASSVVPGIDGCEPGGSGFLNFIDAFTGGAVGTPFVDVDGDGDFSDETLPSDADGDGVNDTITPIGSIDLGVGMPTDPGTLISGPGTGQICQIGSSGKLECKNINFGPGFGRISWREILRD